MPINVAPAPTPPVVRQPRSNKSSSKPPSGKTQTEERTEGLIGLAQIGHAICLMTKQYADAGAIELFAPPFCTEVAKLAESNEKLASGIDYLTAVGPYTAILTVGLQFSLQIAANHKRVDANMLAGAGIVSPDLLEAEQKAKLSKNQAEAVKRAREAERAREQALADMEDME